MNKIVRNEGGDYEICFNITLKQYKKKPVVVFASLLEEPVEIETLEGTVLGNVGDYLICGDNGEYYPCKPDIFAKTYERI